MGFPSSKKEDVTLSELLFPRPSVWYGIARLIDLGAQLDSYNTSPTPSDSDALAMFADWLMVGEDFRGPIEEYIRQHPDLYATAR